MSESESNFYKTIISNYFLEIVTEIEDEYDTFLEVNKLDINFDKLSQNRDEFMKIIESYKVKAFEKIAKISHKLSNEEDIKSCAFKNEHLVYLKSYHLEDRENKFGKLVIFTEYVPIDKINFIKNFKPFMKVEKLDKATLDSILLLLKLDLSIQNPELTKENRQDIWVNNELTFVIDNHIDPKTYQVLDFYIFKIESLEDDLFEEFKNLIELRFNCCSLNQFTNYSFRGLENLKILQLKENAIDFLPTDIFKYLPNIIEINLHYNRLTDIEESLFSNLNSLKHLDLGHNQIGFIDKKAFDSLINLNRLDLHANYLRKIQKSWFKNLKNLHYLNIGKNFESSNFGFKFESDLFESLTNLKTLQLSHNVMENFDYNLFDPLPNLEILDFSKCALGNKIDQRLFKNLKNLKSVSLDLNDIHQIQPFFSHMNKIEIFSIAYNKIETFSNDFFDSFRYLRRLDLHSNNLIIIKKEWFKNLKFLERLELNWNKISFLDSYIFVSLTNLKYLNIQDNNITCIKKECFEGLSNLEIDYDDKIDLFSIIDDYQERSIVLKSHKSVRKFREAEY